MRNGAVFPSFSSPLCSSNSFAAEAEASYVMNTEVEVEAEYEKIYGGGFFLNSQLGNFPSCPHLPPTREISPAFSWAAAGNGLMTVAASEGSSSISSTTSPMRHSSGGGNITMDDDRKQKITLNQVVDRPVKDLKRRKNIQTEDQPHTQPLKAPVKRSQKLGDKITALQQLVSPYGKTDTASVLHAATVYIKVLQEQIQVLSAPYFGVNPSSLFQGGEKLDLSTRGLCLVPIETTINFTRHYSTGQSSSGRTAKRTIPQF